MQVLVTRPESDSAELATRLQELGVEVVVSPLITIAREPLSVADITTTSGLIVTSKNALRSLAANDDALAAARRQEIYCVGDATADEARQLGFDDVRVGGGDGASLVDFIARDRASNTTSARAPLLHLAGDHVAVDLVAHLVARNIEVRAVHAYRSVAAETLEPDVVTRLRHGAVDAVILMSPRTANIWLALIKDADLEAALTGVTYVCLSQAVAAPLQRAFGGHVNGSNVVIAGKPEIEEIVASIKALAARGPAV